MSTTEIFDVEHGQCSLITSTTGEHMLIDCGHNSTSGWRPSSHLASRGIGWLEELMITNCDEDHASDLVALREKIGIGILSRNPTVSGEDLLHLKSQGCMGRGIAALAAMTGGYTEAVTQQPYFDGLRTTQFWNRYPDDFIDENNLSLVSILRWPKISICYAGDMEVAGWKRLLQRPDFRAAMSDITILVASHHGRQNGYCAELFAQTGLNPEMIVISDSGIQYASQETVALYRKHARGFPHNGGRRHVLTTRRDGRIVIDMLSGAVATSR